jgi:hypothetical protein
MMGEPVAEGQEISAADEQGFGQMCTYCNTRNRAWGHVAGGTLFISTFAKSVSLSYVPDFYFGLPDVVALLTSTRLIKKG